MICEKCGEPMTNRTSGRLSAKCDFWVCSNEKCEHVEIVYESPLMPEIPQVTGIAPAPAQGKENA